MAVGFVVGEPEGFEYGVEVPWWRHAQPAGGEGFHINQVVVPGGGLPVDAQEPGQVAGVHDPLHCRG